MCYCLITSNSVCEHCVHLVARGGQCGWMGLTRSVLATFQQWPHLPCAMMIDHHHHQFYEFHCATKHCNYMLYIDDDDDGQT